MTDQQRIGIVSTRLSGTDGVSLEAAKWVDILEELGHECFFLAGEIEWPEARSLLVPQAHFKHPDIRQVQRDLFDNFTRSRQTSQRIHELKELLKDELYRFRDRFHLDLLLVENALSIPMNIPLGLALTETIAETNMLTIAHHHDFAWERRRFKVTAASDYQLGAFPPILKPIQHVTINSYGARQLALRTGVSSMVIPNVMDFDEPPPPPDDYAAGLRAALDIAGDEVLLLQPTRIVPRKRIEHAIELASRLDRRLGRDGQRCVLLISHSAGDEGQDYKIYLQGLAELLNVRVVFAADVTAPRRGETADGRRIFSLADVYQQADLVTYPSSVEGFGNAFLETIYYRKPIVMGTYEIFLRDIEPKGFDVVPIREFITEETVDRAVEILRDPQRTAEMCDHNYELGRRYYSFQTLRNHLVVLLSQSVGA